MDICTDGLFSLDVDQPAIGVAFSPGSSYLPVYYFSRYPDKVAPTWNLLKLFDTPSWILIFTSLISVTIFFFIAAKIGTTYFGIRPIMEEIILSPFR